MFGDGSFAQAMAKERDYQENWAAFQRLQEQMRAQQGTPLPQGAQHQPGGQQMLPFWEQFAARHRSSFQEPGRLRPTEFSSFGDMFDGGGAGRSGDTFAGGGLLSVLGNLTGTKPRGQG
ncbi:MAG: hypothetical protein ACJAVM_002128 [Sulfitobacter sp.]|jgi:hypothetical protein